MEQIEFDIEQVDVNMYTNIANSKDELVKFTRSMLHIPKTKDGEENKDNTKLTELPYFTTDIEYPISRLRRMDYQERVKFFFNQTYFTDILRPYYQPKQTEKKNDDNANKEEVKEVKEVKVKVKKNEDDDEDDDDESYAPSDDEDDEDDDEDDEDDDDLVPEDDVVHEDGVQYVQSDKYYSERERITRKNIKTMLEILLPTKFPVINDIQSSYEYIQNQFSTRPFWFNPFQTHYFSYLNINGKVYTVKKTVWLNDILNHPVYQKILIEYRKLKKWIEENSYNDRNNVGGTRSTPNTSASNPESIFTSTLYMASTQFPNSIQLRKFNSTMRGFIQPLRTSSNPFLQQLINAVTTEIKTPDTIKFYEYLDAVYDKYINRDNEPKTGLNTEILKFINTGICNINIGESNKPTKEVYFMIDLIDGEVNDENQSSISCPFMGEHLGNQLEYLINVPQSKQNKWAVDKNRKIYSLNTMKESVQNSDFKLSMDESESIPSNKLGFGQFNQPESRPTSNNISVEVSSNFMTHIVNNSKFEKSQYNNPDYNIKQAIDKIKKYMVNVILPSIDINRLLDSINNAKSNSQIASSGQELIAIINKWSKDINRQNVKIVEQLNDFKGKLTSIISNLKFKLRSNTVFIDATNLTKNSIEQSIDINNLFLVIVNRLLIHEQSIKYRTTGGTKKRKSLPKKNTRRSRK